MEVAEEPIGRRVAQWRQRRGMSQQVFADRIGKSKSWVDKVERGVRRLDKYSVICDIAQVLGVDTSQLMGREPQRQPGLSSCLDQAEVESIRQSLERYERLGIFLQAASLDSKPIPELKKTVAYTWAAMEKGHYPVVARSLIELLRATPIAQENPIDGTAAEASEILTQVYQIASSVLRKLGEPQLAWLAADRSISAAQRGNDPLLAGTATARVANSLRALGRHQAALDLNVQVAHGLMAEHVADEPTPQALSVYGFLLLQGAMAAALAGESATCKDLLDSADIAAQRMGDDGNYYWTSFGPTNVALHRAAAHVELGEGRAALAVHAQINPAKLNDLVAERRAHHYLDMARACVQIGDWSKAGKALSLAHRTAHSEVRCRPVAHSLIDHILHHSKGSSPPEVMALAEQCGLTK
ncbi:helix-turn-helix domain-containing protein [Natronoglycomyces albus]|uniref:Helix-turn-helix transcriptional regulator n=1 Tax=Natronoglycomyces albus TaxID=2811108 RepID=A0A895XY74_9ACTN|nr:helix-turn-helix domain-containing protein [Natronoglycomyces albus]QSB06568.1 helix-turn-helix transcriptional regulator [Natronoglycomyces albus]